MTLKELRLQKQLTQEEAAGLLKISRKTYIRYENGAIKEDSFKYQYVMKTLETVNFIDEEHGVLTIEQIKRISQEVFKEYNVEFCYLFGSYAKGKANEKSDVDLLVSVPSDGLKFLELVEMLRLKLKKKVDLLDFNQLNNNPELTYEILKDGIRIYE